MVFPSSITVPNNYRQRNKFSVTRNRWENNNRHFSFRLRSIQIFSFHQGGKKRIFSTYFRYFLSQRATCPLEKLRIRKWKRQGKSNSVRTAWVSGRAIHRLKSQSRVSKLAGRFDRSILLRKWAPREIKQFWVVLLFCRTFPFTVGATIYDSRVNCVEIVYDDGGTPIREIDSRNRSTNFATWLIKVQFS